jgi:hypothetical protein
MGSRELFDPWGDGSGIYADEVHVSEHETHSRLLGPDGQPMAYKPRQPVGFNLTPRNGRSHRCKT